MRLPDVDNFFKWNPVTRKIEIDYWKRSILPGWLLWDANQLQGAITIPSLASGLGVATSYFQRLNSISGQNGDLDTPFKASALVFEDSTDLTPNADFTVEMTEVGLSRAFQNAPVHIQTVAGTAQFPSILREPLFLPSHHAVSVKFKKISGGATTARLYFTGGNFYPWGPDLDVDPAGAAKLREVINAWYERKKYVQPYFLTTELPIVLTANQETNFLSKVGGDGHFEAFALAVYSTGDFQIEIQDIASNAVIMNSAISKNSGLGNAQTPTLFASSYLIPADSKINWKIKDLSNSGNTVWLTLQGRKIYAPFQDIDQVLNDTEVTLQTAQDLPAPASPEPFQPGMLQGMGSHGHRGHRGGRRR